MLVVVVVDCLCMICGCGVLLLVGVLLHICPSCNLYLVVVCITSMCCVASTQDCLQHVHHAMGYYECGQAWHGSQSCIFVTCQMVVLWVWRAGGDKTAEMCWPTRSKRNQIREPSTMERCHYLSVAVQPAPPCQL